MSILLSIIYPFVSKRKLTRLPLLHNYLSTFYTSHCIYYSYLAHEIMVATCPAENIKVLSSFSYPLFLIPSCLIKIIMHVSMCFHSEYNDIDITIAHTFCAFSPLIRIHRNSNVNIKKAFITMVLKQNWIVMD